MIQAAIQVAGEGLAAGELPIGAVVVMGDQVVGRACTQERGRRRRLVHADLLAMIQADEHLGWARRAYPLQLAVTLEPCLMCLGAAMTLGVGQVCYALESPADGAAAIADHWQPASPDLPGYAVPSVTGAILRLDSRVQPPLDTAHSHPPCQLPQKNADQPARHPPEHRRRTPLCRTERRIVPARPRGDGFRNCAGA
jgi:tRNA(adenine34) deaminase